MTWLIASTRRLAVHIEILGAESLGVRSLACMVETAERKIVIDPGVALGYRRHGLLPHPVQAAASEAVKTAIEKALQSATDVVISHYHGDHHPMVNANPYQLSVEQVIESCKNARFWTKGTSDLSLNQANRAKSLAQKLNRALPAAEGMSDGSLRFSVPVPHGEHSRRNATVMMTRIEDEDGVFVHASDIQMLNDEAIEIIIAWQPTVVLAAGPPIYLPIITSEMRENALRRTMQLAKEVDTLILDHHVMRSKVGERWLNSLYSPSKRKVICAADFMGRRRRLLEAERVQWYKKVPVPDGWHEAYARGEVSVKPYQRFLDAI